MHILQCSLPLAGYPRGVASRPCPDGDGAALQTLVATSMGELRILLGTDQRCGLEFGAALDLFVPARAGSTSSAPQRYEPTTSFRDPVWDPFSSSIFLLDGQAVMRLTSNNSVTLVAGHRTEIGDADGQGAAARFGFPRFPVSDGAGSLFLADGSRICRVKLPTVWRTGGQSTEPSRTTFSFEAEVVTIATVPGDIAGLAFVEDWGSGGSTAAAGGGPSAAGSVSGLGAGTDRGEGAGGPSLIYATETAIYRLPLGGCLNDGDAAAAAAVVAAPKSVLLAGCEGVTGYCDGRGAIARFSHISGIVADGGGSSCGSGSGGSSNSSSILIADVDEDDGEVASLRRLGPDGVVSSVSSCLEGSTIWPAILPNGYLALCNICPGALLLLDLGLTPPRGGVVARATTAASAAAAAAAAGAAGGGAGSAGAAGGYCHGSGGGFAASAAGASGAGGRSLSSDLGTLLDRQPDGTADLTIIVGGRTFHVHRGILAARCDYFRQRLTGGFPDGAASSLSLPDADPDAFAALLRFLYTGAPDSLPSALLQPLAELADRLLLPELCAAAQAQLLAAVTLENVVELLIWAVDRGQAFEGALARLVAWYLEHQVEVMEHSPEAVKRLMVNCPDLAFEVHMAAAKLARR